MQSNWYTYLFHVQYLGLRYAGWQKQEGVRTIQGTLERSFRYLLGQERFKILAAGRTDAGVSANRAAFELFSQIPINLDSICDQANQNLPTDIRLLEVQEIGRDFNIIHDVAWKEYRYNLAFGEKFHPFAGGYLGYFAGNPDIELIQGGLALLKGIHDFRRFCSVDKISDNYDRTILETSLSRHPQAGLGYIPEKSYTMGFKGKGFLRYQVRIMVGALIDLGMGKLSLAEFEEALSGQGSGAIAIQAPAHGLVLEDIVFSKL
jgi:tRNA pseudouridine38-40 synthase